MKVNYESPEAKVYQVEVNADAGSSGPIDLPEDTFAPSDSPIVLDPDKFNVIIK